MNVYGLIACMATVTFLPRMIPGFVVDKIKINRYFECFLRLIPYTSMTALVFPGVFGVDPERWYVGAVGAGVAIVLGWIPKMPSGVVVLGSVLSVLIFFL